MPLDKPETMPELMPAEAIAVLLLVHVPPFTASLNVASEPAQTFDGPEIVDGGGTTVSVVAAAQPVLSVNVILVVPAVSPDTMPVDDVIVATVLLLLVHVPGAEASLSVVPAAVHIIGRPVIAAGNGLITTPSNAMQPLLRVYVIIAVPAPVPVKIPVDPIPAIAVLLLLQVPEGVASESVVVAPWQIIAVPPIGAGAALEVITLVMLHPVGNVYVITDVPAFKPVTTPVLPSIDVLVLLLVHVPPPASLSAAVAPTQTAEGPEIAAGVGFTVTVAKVRHPVVDNV